MKSKKFDSLLTTLLKTEPINKKLNTMTTPTTPKTEVNKPLLFRKFWVKSVNNWLCDADYNGKRLKDNNPIPTFRKFYFIKNWEDLKGFTPREGIDNKELVEKWLAQCEAI